MLALSTLLTVSLTLPEIRLFACPPQAAGDRIRDINEKRLVERVPLRGLHLLTQDAPADCKFWAVERRADAACAVVAWLPRPRALHGVVADDDDFAAQIFRWVISHNVATIDMAAWKVHSPFLYLEAMYFTSRRNLDEEREHRP
jgi:phage gp46-like protein